MAVLALAMVVGFVSFSWVEIEPQALRLPVDEDTEAIVDDLDAVAVLLQQDSGDDTIKLSAREIWAGNNAHIPTFDLDRAAQGSDQVRFVDRFLIVIPFFALLLLLVSGFFMIEYIPSRTAMIAFVALGLTLLCLPTMWQGMSRVDWLGYDQIQDIRGPDDRQSIVGYLAGFYSTGEQQLLAFLVVGLGVVGWILNGLTAENHLNRGYLSELRENVGRGLRSKDIQWYVTAIGLLIGTIVLLRWFVPQAREAPVSFYQYTYQGISDGALLALIALGLVLIYKASDVINFAHGEFMMIGAYLFSELMVRYDVSLSVGLIGTAALMVLLGGLVERFILRPLIGEPIISVIMVTIGMSNIFHAIVGMQWKNQPQDWKAQGSDIEGGFLNVIRQVLPADSGLRRAMEAGPYQVFEEGKRLPAGAFQYEQVFLIGIVLLFILLLSLMFKYSKQGVAMRATADDQQAALSMGISVKRIFAIAWGIAALFAGAAGLLVGDVGTGATIDIPSKGLRAFPVIILGGLDSITGAIVGGLMIGLLEQYAVGYVDPWIKASVPGIIDTVQTKEVIPYIVLIGILMFRPYGLFGQEIIERV
jgi:branched-chain amino acid transport system permease protein